MKIKKNFLLFVPLMMIFLMGQSCISFSGKTPAGNNLGVFKTVDNGETWSQKVILMTSGKTVAFPSASITTMKFDPSDNNAIYAGTSANGIFYTYYAADIWQQPAGVSAQYVNSIVIDPKDKCNIYLSSGNTIGKSTDCNRSYERIYQDTRPTVTITSLEIDFYNTNILYAGNTEGDILKSIDFGETWEVIERFAKSKVSKIFIDPNDSRIIYVALEDKGLQKSIDSGNTWEDISAGLNSYPNSTIFRDLVFVPSKRNMFYHVSEYGILKTTDGGNSWSEISLLTPPASTDIFALAVNPKNENEIYYVTTNTFYSSIDGGQTWKTKKLPTTQIPNKLLIDPINPDIMYLGVRAIK